MFFSASTATITTNVRQSAPTGTRVGVEDEEEEEFEGWEFVEEGEEVGNIGFVAREGPEQKKKNVWNKFVVNYDERGRLHAPPGTSVRRPVRGSSYFRPHRQRRNGHISCIDGRFAEKFELLSPVRHTKGLMYYSGSIAHLHKGCPFRRCR